MVSTIVDVTPALLTDKILLYNTDKKWDTLLSIQLKLFKQQSFWYYTIPFLTGHNDLQSQ